MAFVHLHNHTDFSLLDGATNVKAMVKRAVDLKMPAVAITDHGYMFGVPDLDLACAAYNKNQADYQQWFHDKDNYAKGREIVEPDVADEAAHAQWAKDVAAHEAGQDLETVKPAPLIRPIFGCEAYFTPDNELSKGKKPELYHMILLAKNQKGYVNLMQMMSDAAVRGYYYKPRTTLEMLQAHSEGVICSSACVAGIIPRHILNGQPDEALKWARIFKETFAPGDFYIEIQDHGLTFENGMTDRQLDEQLVELAHSLDLKVIATNDFHYLTRDDAPTQDLMMCIGTGAKIDDENRMRMEGTEFYMKTEEEMRELFSWCPEACDNTVELAEKCNVELDWDSIILPNFPLLDPGETHESQFRRECEEGLAKRYGPDWETREINGVNIKERFEFEYKIICDKGFAAYFLIVQEYVRWAKQNGIGVGPGRGSAAGAIVAYAMDITTFDPLENGLMFERFLSPERSEMPDIDMDFDDERRLDVIEHVRQLYGPDKVTRVITYGKIKAKNAINDAARVLDYPVYMGQRLSKMVSSSPSATLKATLEKVPGKEDQYSQDFVDEYNNNADARRIIDAALALEGKIRGEGVHACATLICRDPVNEHVPTKLDTKGGDEITQYEGHTVADMGLLKMDFLGLRTLTVISKAKENIKKNYGIDIDVDAIPFDDPAIFELLASGKTAGVFQVESAGMTATIKNMKPTEYKHVVALIALYRPGPLGAGMVDSYIKRMNGKEEAVSYDPRLDNILGETYGTMVYQEQVMLISVQMCGFSKGESDSRIRKPVAKKKLKMLTEDMFHWSDGADETIYEHWMNGAERNDYSRETAQRIWDDVLEFASYAFNKSHSAGYAILVMQTAWLKAHYPNEFMAAVLTSYTGKTEKIVHYVNSCHHEGIDILPPDINESGTEFTAVKEGVRFGLAGIRGVGEGVAEVIIKERERGGTFKNLHDLVERVDPSACNRRVVEALIKAGAFDSTGYTRKQLMGFVDKNNPANIMDTAAKRQKDRAAGQSSMFDMFGDVSGSGFEDEIPEPDNIEWDRSMKLALEKEVLGIYVSDHPLRPYEYALAKARDHSITEALSGFDRTDALGNTKHIDLGEEAVWLAGMVSGVQKKTTKTGDAMAVFKLQDIENEIDVVVFPKTYKKSASILAGTSDEQTGEQVGDIFVRVLGRIDRSDRGDQLLASKIEPLELSDTNNRPKVLEIMISPQILSRLMLENLQKIFELHPGYDRVELYVESADGNRLRMEVPVRVDAKSVMLMARVQDLIGKQGHATVA